MTQPKYIEKNWMVTILLAVLFGSFGFHKFYLGDLKKGTIYLVFCWTGIPLLLGWYDAFKYATNKQEFGESMDFRNEFETKYNEIASKRDDPLEELPEEDTSISLPPDAVMAVKGVNGKVTLYDDRLEISRDGIGMLHKMQHGFKGDKEMPYESITSVQLRKPSSVTRGYIQFGQSGFSESDDGLLDATSDENTVLFDKDSLSEFEELRTKIRDLKKGDIKESTGSMDGAMEKLRERYASGEIDEEEYKNRKEILQE